MMRKFLFLLPVALVLAACGDKETADGGKESEELDEHAHAAKHGGDLLELGAHEGFLEVKMDHDKGEVRVWAYLGEELMDTKLAQPPVLNFKADDKPMQLTAEAQSDGSWVFTSDALKSEPEGARFRVVVGGKTYSPEWAHGHQHDHDHDHEGHEDEGHEDHDHEDHDHEHGEHEEDGSE